MIRALNVLKSRFIRFREAHRALITKHAVIQVSYFKLTRRLTGGWAFRSSITAINFARFMGPR